LRKKYKKITTSPFYKLYHRCASHFLFRSCSSTSESK